jgi:hypothetical protein
MSEYAEKNRRGRALRILRAMREAGVLDPATMTDQELLRVRGLGRKVIPELRELVRKGRPLCPHCGLPVDMPNAKVDAPSGATAERR